MAVLMRHPNLPGQETPMPASSVEQWKLAGWEVVEGQEEQGEQWPEEARPYEGQPVVHLTHPNPDVRDDIWVPESAVPEHRARGWLVVGSDEEQEQAAAGLENLTVAELQGHIRALNEHRADDQQLPISGTKAELIQRIQDAEAEGPAADTSKGE